MRQPAEKINLSSQFQHLCSEIRCWNIYSGADKSFYRPGRKQATATEDFIFIYPIYNHNWRNISII